MAILLSFCSKYTGIPRNCECETPSLNICKQLIYIHILQWRGSNGCGTNGGNAAGGLGVRPFVHRHSRRDWGPPVPPRRGPGEAGYPVRNPIFKDFSSKIWFI